MIFDHDIYYGYIIKGDLNAAISYVRQFPEQADLHDRFTNVFAHEQYKTYEVCAELSRILIAYQQYYRDVFYLCIGKERSAELLRARLSTLLGADGVELCDLEQNYLPELFQSHGLHFLGGQTGGYYGPYIWRTTETASYDVELPDGIQTYTVKLLDGFITRSWIDHLSFGEIGPGGWADGDGCINCVRSAWDFEGESFRVSLLKHEAQHARDIELCKDMTSENLEYRAKLVELIYSCERNLLQTFAQEADISDPANGHAMAAHRIMMDYSDDLGVDRIDPAAVDIAQIQTIAKALFKRSHAKE